MIDEKIASSILTVGCSFHHPMGGIAQVMYNYDRYVFPIFKTIENSGGNNKLYKFGKAIWSLLLMVMKLAVDKKIQIVHIHTASYNSFRRSVWHVKLAKLFKKKVIIHIHGGGFKEYYETNPQWITSNLNCADALITLSDMWKEYFEKVTCYPKIFVVENIVPEPVFKESLKHDDKFHFLFLGLITEEKGIFDLIDVLHEYNDDFKGNLVLHIGGNGKIQKLIKLIDAYNLGDIVKYEGFVTGAEKESLLKNCDAFILPSYIEGLPVSILEAMSYGKPILTTPVGGIPEMVKNNDNGILFSPGDSENIRKAICELLFNRTRVEKMGRKSLQYIRPCLPSNISKKLESIYQIYYKS